MSAAGWALVLYGIYGLLAFGVRGIVQRRRTGDSGFRGFSGTVGSPEWFAGILFALAIAAGVLGPVADIFGWLDALDAPIVGVGAVLAVVGIGATVTAQFAMGNSWRVGVDKNETTELVTGGPFDWVRNPIFTAMIFTALGLAAMVPNLLSIGGAVGLVVGLELHVRLIEEPYLTGVHGDSYRRYASRVGRFLPGIGRLRP